MSTQVLTFNLPLNPKPNSNNNFSVLHTGNGWTLTVRKTGSNREINTAQKTVNVTLSVSHYTAFCNAFQGNSGTKSVTVNYTGSLVNSITWDSTTIQLPDGGSFAPIAAALADEAGDAAHDSKRLS